MSQFLNEFPRWIVLKVIAVADLLCDIRARSRNFFHADEGGDASGSPGSGKSTPREEGEDTGNAEKRPLTHNIFCYFVALIAGILYYAFWLYLQTVGGMVQVNPGMAATLALSPHFSLVFHVLLGLTVVAYYKGTFGVLNFLLG